jgi:hypothetical protein
MLKIKALISVSSKSWQTPLSPSLASIDQPFVDNLSSFGLDIDDIVIVLIATEKG